MLNSEMAVSQRGVSYHIFRMMTRVLAANVGERIDRVCVFCYHQDMGRIDHLRIAVVFAIISLCTLTSVVFADVRGSMRTEQPLRAFLLKLGEDVPAGSADFDTNVWNEVTARLAANGLDALVVDLGDGIVWPSHPELAVPAAWDVPRLKAELERLRKLGLEPLPLVPTRHGEAVTDDLVRDAVSLFARPRVLLLDDGVSASCKVKGLRRLAFALEGEGTKGVLMASGRETVREERDALLNAAFHAGEAFAVETAARPTPDWFARAVIYQMQLRAFTPEGTLAAAQKRLGRIRDLGFDVVYLCPIWVADDNPDRTKWSGRQRMSGMDNPRNPYIMKDYDHVDPQYGTDDDFKAFVNEAHRLGLRVMTDLVYRHCGWGAGFLKKHRDYAMRNPDGTVRVVDPGFPLPRLDFASRGLRDMFVANMVRMVRDFGVDGFRTDMSDEVALDFWTEGRAACERYRPDLVMIAEGVHPGNLVKTFNANYAHFSCREGLMPLLYGGRSLPGIFGANTLKEGAKSFRGAFEWETGWLPRGGRLMTFIENHDTAQEGMEDRAERILGSANQAAGLATLMALPGVPLVYNGQEICDASRLSLFAQSGRNVIDWSREASPEAQERTALLKRLIDLRHRHPALTSTLIEWLDNDCPQSVVSFVRRDGKGDELLFVANLGATAVKAKVSGRGAFDLAPWEFRFIER